MRKRLNVLLALVTGKASLIDLPMSVDAEVNDYWYGENLAEKYGV